MKIVVVSEKTGSVIPFLNIPHPAGCLHAALIHWLRAEPHPFSHFCRNPFCVSYSFRALNLCHFPDLPLTQELFLYEEGQQV